MNKIASIQVFGSGCPTCKKLFETTKEVSVSLGLKIEVEYVTDIQKIIELGLMSSPVLMINGQAVLVGNLPSVDRLKEIISSYDKEDNAQPACGCSCGSKC